MTAPSWYGEDYGIDLSDRTADAPVGSVIEWRTWCGPTRATVVSYGQGIYGAAGVSLRSSDGHVESHPSGLPRGWQLVSAARVRTFGRLEDLDALRVPSDLCTVCGHYSDEVHHGACEITAERVA